MAIKLLIADAHEVARLGVAAMLAGSEIKVVAAAASAAEAVKLVVKHKPDVVLLDVLMQDLDGLEALEKIRAAAPHTRIIMWSTSESPTYIAHSSVFGASDYLIKSVGRQQLIATIAAAAGGKCPTATGQMLRVVDLLASKTKLDHDDADLTPREWQVLRHIALGLSNKAIASSLSLSVETVKEHVQNILRKLAVTDRTQAAVWAVRKGLA